MTPERRRHVALHEAGHAVASDLFGMPLEYVSIRPGETFDGITSGDPHPIPPGFDASRPVAAQPHEVRAAVERRILGDLAGDVAARYLAAEPATVRCDPLEAAEIDRQALTAVGPRTAELVVREEERTEPHESDEAKAWELADAFAGPETGWRYLEWLRSEARDLAIRYHPAILRVADALERSGILTGEQVAALVHPPRGA